VSPLAVDPGTAGLVLLGAFALLFVPLLVVPLVADPETRRYYRQRHGVSGTGVALAVVVGVGSVLAAVRAGSFPASARSLAVPLVGLTVGLVGLVFAATHARRLVALFRADEAATGEATGGRVAVTGTVRADDPGESPVFGCDAVAWEWRVEAKNRHGTNYEGRRAWDTVETGSGGVPFVIDDGSGPLRVDPADALLDVRDERREERAPGDPPGRVGELADADGGGERYRFVESALAPGTRATVLGSVAGGSEGPARSTDAGALLVTDAPRRAAVRRYGVRAAGFGAAGGVLVVASALVLRSLVGL